VYNLCIGDDPMFHQRPDPGYIPRLHQILETLQAEIAEPEEATTAFAPEHRAVAPILVQTAARPIAPALLAPVPLAALPDTLADIPADCWTLTASVLLVPEMQAPRACSSGRARGRHRITGTLDLM
jgi:hypothetical protein